MENFKIKDITYNANGSKNPAFHIVRFSYDRDGKSYPNMVAIMQLTDDPGSADCGNCFVVNTDNPVEVCSSDDVYEEIGDAILKIVEEELGEDFE
jgi:hypothetical protein